MSCSCPKAKTVIVEFDQQMGNGIVIPCLRFGCSMEEVVRIATTLNPTWPVFNVQSQFSFS